MRKVRITLIAVFVVGWQAANLASAGLVLPGYSGPNLASPNTSDYQAISQMAFDPGDPNHLYAARFSEGSTGGVITRYDYSTATGQVTDPITVATVAGAPLGLAFFNNDLYVSTTNNSTGTGGITRYQAGADGTFGNGVEFINNIPTGEHQVDQLQVQGNSLYVGIGTKTDAGVDNTQGVQESVYNGTISEITDLTKANYSADGADNLPLSSVLTDADPGKLHVYASGFRNPFGVLVTATGQVWDTDNGQDSPVTPDYLYKGLLQDDVGKFPTQNPGNPISPLGNLGLDTAGTGLALIPLGADQGSVLVGLFHHDLTNPSPALGNEVVLVDPVTGVVTPAFTGLTSVTDIITDSQGRILLSDYGDNFDNGYNPNSGGIYELAAVPEPSPWALLLTALPIVGVAARHRR